MRGGVEGENEKSIEVSIEAEHICNRFSSKVFTLKQLEVYVKQHILTIRLC